MAFSVSMRSDLGRAPTFKGGVYCPVLPEPPYDCSLSTSPAQALFCLQGNLVNKERILGQIIEEREQVSAAILVVVLVVFWC